jgi:hypothetical protein
MGEMLKEFGKAILQFANIVSGVVLFKTFIESSKLSLLFLAIILMAGLYAIGLLLIKEGGKDE